MLNRRNLFAATAAASVVGSTMTGRKAASRLPTNDIEPRGTDRRLERLPRLDLESQEDFLTGFRAFVNTDLTVAATKRAFKILKENGFTPRDDVPLKQALELLADDPIIGTRFRTWTSTQQMMWRNLMDEFHGNAEAYFAEMEAVDNSGPGTLELNPDMEIPNYARYEIHVQPGGYVGDPFAGHVYHYGTNNFYTDTNNQDEMHISMANAVPRPPSDGKVRRILDLGCGVGQLTVALKERFPEAEVWGIDVGGPMVRFSHMRAVDLGVDVNFAQRLAEDTKFPDGHFDIVTSYILHHEIPEETSKQVTEEAYRVLRPGGVFYPIDFYTGLFPQDKSPWGKVRWWWTYRWNQEVWYPEYARFDFPAAMRATGFEVNEKGPPAWARVSGVDDTDVEVDGMGNGGRQRYGRNLLGVKPV